MSIERLRITASKLLPYVREAARSSSNVVFIPPLEKRSMAGMITFHQAFRCLQEGRLVGQPVQNPRGDWELRLEYFSAGVLFRLRVVAVCDGARVRQLIVFPSGATHV